MAVEGQRAGCSEDLLSRPRTEDVCSSRAVCPPRGKSPDRGQRVPRAAGARSAPQPTHAAETLPGRAGERGAGIRHGHRHAGSAEARPASRGRSTNRTGLTLRPSLFWRALPLFAYGRSSAKSRRRQPSRAGLLLLLELGAAPCANACGGLGASRRLGAARPARCLWRLGIVGRPALFSPGALHVIV